jgi:BirA family biotin operon repressor/biotin-[acetyl-CoA-carboxylase] ligase
MARIKWPNDVVIGTRKIAGVLGEVRGSEPVVREMVVGMGVNVNQRADEFPPEIRPLATSVRIEKGNPGDRAPILAALLRGFEERYGRLLRDGPRALLAEWDGLTLLPPGRRITVAGPAGRLEGTVAGVDDEGALLLRDAAGRTLRVPFGEIVQAAPI